MQTPRSTPERHHPLTWAGRIAGVIWIAVLLQSCGWSEERGTSGPENGTYRTETSLSTTDTVAPNTREGDLDPGEKSPEANGDQVAPGERVALERVVDGDTVVLADGRRIRLLGIDTPETKHPSKGVECYGPEASQFGEERLGGNALRLESDGSTDRYGRTLGYLWYEDAGVWVDYGLLAVEKGMAELYRAATHKYQEAYEDAETEAELAGRGLWGVC